MTTYFPPYPGLSSKSSGDSTTPPLSTPESHPEHPLVPSTLPSAPSAPNTPNSRHNTPPHDTPAQCSPQSGLIDNGYEAIRVGTQKRKCTEISADSSASDISMIFSPKKKAKLNQKIEQLASELQPYQFILSNLGGSNTTKYQCQIKQLMFTLKDKGFLSSDSINLMANEV
ncbi:hypothetical protein AX14_007366 [Amanita brunnescens Koide BX004]|jgi:hypothetical protein|nr:hypothetical protein AX14_007366 [Amanita brunnescens Koide BX004]